MISFLLRLAISAGALLVIANYSGGAVSVSNAQDAFIAALVLGLANALIKPILGFIAGALTLPLSCITLGLWNLVLSWLLNAAMFYGVAEVLEGFDVRSFAGAMFGSLALSVANALASGIGKNKNDD